jgi:acyl carrier protein
MYNFASSKVPGGKCMQQSEVYIRLTKIFQDTLDQEVVLTPQTSAQDVEGWDSIAHIRLTAAIEAEFGVRFKTSDLEKMHRVGDIVALIMLPSSAV